MMRINEFEYVINQPSPIGSNLEPLVSVVMPAYNAEEYLPAAIKSVLAQSYNNWELLVIVDAKSNQETFDVAESFARQDVRVRVVRNEKNGVSKNRNLALSLSKGEFIAFLDADDLWSPDKLRLQIDFMVKNNYAITYHGFQPVSPTGDATGKPRMAKYTLSYNDLLKNNNMGCLTVVARADLIKKYQFEEIYHEDFSFWLKILGQDNKAFALPEVLASYRIVPNSRSSNKFLCAVWRWKLYRHNKIPLFKSLYYMFLYVVFAIHKRL